MRILALDLGKQKTAAFVLDRGSDEQRHLTVKMTSTASGCVDRCYGRLESAVTACSARLLVERRLPKAAAAAAKTEALHSRRRRGARAASPRRLANQRIR